MSDVSFGTWVLFFLLKLVMYVVIGFGFCLGVWLCLTLTGRDTTWIKDLQRRLFSAKEAKEAKKDDETKPSNNS